MSKVCNRTVQTETEALHEEPKSKARLGLSVCHQSHAAVYISFSESRSVLRKRKAACPESVRPATQEATAPRLRDGRSNRAQDASRAHRKGSGEQACIPTTPSRLLSFYHNTRNPKTSLHSFLWLLLQANPDSHTSVKAKAPGLPVRGSLVVQ